MVRALAGLMGVALCLGPALPAEAYVRTMTCRALADPATDPLACKAGESPVPLFWDEGCVVYHVNPSGFPDGEPVADVLEAIRRSFATWDSVDCSDLALVEGGQTDEDRVGYNSCEPGNNANVVMFRDTVWGHQAGALALTSVTYNMETGEIVDADMELNNTGAVTFTTSDVVTQIAIDVQNTVTHEVGHIIGFDHTPVADATMFATAPRGETKKRDLHQDDIDALCTVYPIGRNLACDTSNVGFFRRPAEGPGTSCDADRKGCACSVGSGRFPGPMTWLGMVGLLVAAWRRRRSVGRDSY